MNLKSTILLLITFFFSYSLQAQTPDYNNPDTFAQEVFSAVKSNNRQPLGKFLLKKDEDKVHIADVYSKSHKDKDADPVNVAIRKLMDQQKWDLENDFTALVKKGQNEEIYWAKAVITSIKYTPVVKKKVVIPETEFVVEFSSKGKSYVVSWKAISGKTSWLMGKDLKMDTAK